MTKLLEKAGASFLRAFAVTFLFASTGILNAKDVNETKALAIAAAVASLAAGFRALQVFVPQLSVGAYISEKYASIIDSGVRAFLSTFLVSLIGVTAAPNLGAVDSLLLAGVIASATAALRAVQGFFTEGENPVPTAGA